MKRLSIKNTMIAVCTASALLLFSCSKTGPEGPQGIQGTNGQPGTPGTPGNPGPKGDPGTANVKYSAWTTFNSANWGPSVLEFGKHIRYYPVPASTINADIMNNGVVLMYIRVTITGIGPTLLPQTFYNFTQPVNQYLGFSLSTGLLKVKFFNIDNINDPGTFGSVVEYRYVIIPGGVSLATRNQSTQVDYSDYNAVKALYNLPD